MPGLFDGSKWERPVTCEHCGKAQSDCNCPRDASGAICLPKHQPARVRRERRGGGKIITIVSGLDERATDLPALLKRWKAELGAGGTIASGCIELQGDHRDRIVRALVDLGYPAKSAGG